MRSYLAPLTVLVVMATYGIPVRSEEARNATVEESIQALSHLGLNSMAEPAGARGSYGTQLGLGYQKYSYSEDNLLLQKILGEQDRTPTDVTRLYLLQGLPWPVDLGGTVGWMRGSSVLPASAFVQITPWEQIGWPTLSLRYIHGQVFGLTDAELITNTVEINVSKSLLGIFKFFAGVSASRYQMELSGEIPEIYGLSETPGERYIIDESQTSVSAGAKIILDGHYDVVGEWHRDDTAQSSWTAKFNVLL